MIKQSFIFYETIEEMLLELPDEEFVIFSKATMAYGLHGTEPNFTGIQKALWTQIKFCIDNSKEYRKKQSENALKRYNKDVASCNNAEPTTANSCQHMPNTTIYLQNMPNENENVNVNVNENEEEREKEQEKQNISLSPSVDLDINIPKDYAKQVFDILSENQLPCCFNNFITFMQTDFKRALETLHGPELKGFHSDMILGALKNYAQVVNNPNTWQGWKNKKSFDRFISWDRFWDFLPDRFCLENFLDRSTPPPKQAQNQTVGVNRALEILREVQNDQG